MKYSKTVRAKFVARPNRFIAHVIIEGQSEIEVVHVKNTGRCKELLLPGVTVILYDSNNPARKTRYDLIAVYKEGLGLINMDSQAPNEAVKEWLMAGAFSDDKSIFPDITYLKPECKYGDSRVDFYLEQENNSKTFIEVKGVTLERDKIGFFPDAPTERSVKHIHELIKAKKEGYNAYIAFVIQMPDVSVVYPNDLTDPAFGSALRMALKNGVKILYLYCAITEASMQITGGKVVCELNC